MARKRMFCLDVVDTDSFMDLPASAQCLYFHLGVRADDDGFVSNPKRIFRMIGCGPDDLDILIEREFIIPFQSGIIVIADWRINNYLQKDRYHPTIHTDEMDCLMVDENGRYIRIQ